MFTVICPWSLQMCITRSNHQEHDLLDPFIKFLPSPRLILDSYMHYFKKIKKASKG